MSVYICYHSHVSVQLCGYYFPVVNTNHLVMLLFTMQWTHAFQHIYCETFISMKIGGPHIDSQGNNKVKYQSLQPN